MEIGGELPVTSADSKTVSRLDSKCSGIRNTAERPGGDDDRPLGQGVDEPSIFTEVIR